MTISSLRQGDITVSDSDIGSNYRVTWDIGISKIRQGTWEIISDRDMRHWDFLKSICDIRTPVKGPTQALNDSGM